jgi:hypothetical protein
VVKEVWGWGGHGSYVHSNAHDHLQDIPMSRREVIDQLEALGPLLWMPLLIEEHIRRPDGSYGPPLEYKFYVFRDRVEAISMRMFNDPTLGFYTPDWTLMPEPLMTTRPVGPKQKPDCLAEMVETAQRLGEAYGDAVRVDLFWTDRGCVFNEYASVPAHGYGLTDFGSEYLGDCWQRMLDRFPAAAEEQIT